MSRIDADQLRKLHEADPESSFSTMADLFNGKLDEAEQRIKEHAGTAKKLRASRVSRAILDQLADSGSVPDDHADDESVKKLVKLRKERDDALALAESRKDYDDLRKQLEDAGRASAGLQAQLDEATGHLTAYRAKEDQTWRADSILATATEHKIPLRSGLVRFAEQTLRPYWARGSNGSPSLTRDGKPLIDAEGKEVTPKMLLEDLKVGKYVGVDSIMPDLFDQITEGPSTRLGDGSPPAAIEGSPDLNAAIQSGDPDAINKAAWPDQRT